jgi:hypothetical protein
LGGTPLRDAATELAAKPSRKSALRGKAQELSDGRQRTTLILDEPNDHFGPLFIENVGKTLVVFRQAPLHGATVAAQVLGYALQ